MHDAAPKPWYRQFWLWFVITPLIATVIASFVTLYIAGSPPALVVDDFGRIEMTVERDEARDRRAAELGLAAEVQFDPGPADEATAVAVTLAGAAPAALRLSLIHPTRQDRDHEAVLARTGAAYGGSVVRPGSRVYLIVTDDRGEWRLAGEIGPGQQAVTLRARAGR